MKKNIHIFPLVGFFSILTVFACRKSITEVEPVTIQHHQHDTTQTKHDTTKSQHDTFLLPKKDTVKPVVPYPQSVAPVAGCPVLPIYGDSLIYPQPTNGSDYI